MRQFSIALADNPVGADPLVGLYKGINKNHSGLGLTQANSKILKIQAAATLEKPFQTVVIIQRDGDLDKTYDLYYERFDIRASIKNPYWTAAEVTKVQAIEDSSSLLEEIVKKSKLNLTEDDVWISETSIDYTGGKVRPNWLFKTVANSVYFTGELVMWLHSGGDDPGPPDPEPGDGPYEHIFEGIAANYIPGQFGNPGNYVSLSVQQNGNRVYVYEPIPEGEKVPSLNWPAYHENDPEVLIPGHEWVIINNSGHDLNFDPEATTRNKFYLPNWDVIAIRRGGTLRGTAIKWNAGISQWEWAITGDLVKGRSAGSGIKEALVSWYSMEGIANDDHGGNNFGFNFETVIDGKVGKALNKIKASGAEGNYGSYNSGISMFGWFKVNVPATVTEYVFTLGKFNQYYGCKFGLSYQAANGWKGFTRNAQDAETTVSTGGQHMATGAWQFVVLQVKDRFLEISVNGGNPIRREIPTPSSASYSGVQLGELFSNAGFDGGVDELGICGRPLEPEEIAYLYNNGAGRTYATLV